MIEITNRPKTARGRKPTDEEINHIATSMLLTDIKWEDHELLKDRPRPEHLRYRSELSTEMLQRMAIGQQRGRHISTTEADIVHQIDPETWLVSFNNTHVVRVKLAGRYWVLGYFSTLTSAIRYGDMAMRIFAVQLPLVRTRSAFPIEQTSADMQSETQWRTALQAIRTLLMERHGLPEVYTAKQFGGLSFPEADAENGKAFIEEANRRFALLSEARQRRAAATRDMQRHLDQFHNWLNALPAWITFEDPTSYLAAARWAERTLRRDRMQPTPATEETKS